MPPSLNAPTAGARAAASRALTYAAQQFPDITPQPIPDGGLSPVDVRLALAIHRTAIQRWITLEYMLDNRLSKPIAKLEPAMAGVLIAAAAQLLFMDRLPVHAVVHESVSLARRMVRPAASGMANAVLRKLADAVVSRNTDTHWSPAADRLPLEQGYVQLAASELPAVTSLAEHLAVATSHPEHLVARWIDAHGRDAAQAIALHGIANPPTVVHFEQGLDLAAFPYLRPHNHPGCAVWEGSREELIQFLAAHTARRVQDPTATLPVAATRGLQPRLVVDLCAGRGTKTRQLAITHPNARIIATDTDGQRYADLRNACRRLSNVEVMPAYQIDNARGTQGVDLLLLDVPCSNTGVLARRPEARYRFGDDSLRALVAIQRRIIERAVPLLAPEGTLLYSTCSIEPEENQRQTRWLCDKFKMSVSKEELTLPSGTDSSNRHDGGYFALVHRSRPE